MIERERELEDLWMKRRLIDGLFLMLSGVDQVSGQVPG